VTFILVPKNGEDTQVNAWNWRPTLELMPLRSDQRGAVHTHGANGMRSSGLMLRWRVAIADVVERRLLSMKPGGGCAPT